MGTNWIQHFPSCFVLFVLGGCRGLYKLIPANSRDLCSCMCISNFLELISGLKICGLLCESTYILAK